MDELYFDNAGAIVVITPLEGKMAPALRVVAKKPPLGVAYTDVGKEREQERKLCSSLIWNDQTALLAPGLVAF